MTAVLSGTNGLLQSYDYQAPTTGFSYTFASGTQMLVMNPAGTLATGTITMPAAPVDGMTITFSSSQQITALTMAGNGATINSAVTFLPAKAAAAYVYRATGTTWFPIETVPGTGSQLVSGTAVAATSGTSIDFTEIPSWAKRITAVLSGISTNGTSTLQCQLGTTAGVTTSGYSSTLVSVATAASTGLAVSTGFGLVNGPLAANFYYGQIILTLLDSTSNFWGATSTVTAGGTLLQIGGGGVTLSGALTTLRLTTVGGTNTFDAGSINILYE